ncbi:dGTPase [Frondihabitans sp. PhB161]|nr:dGTPase [Frondihabitans sp. PhB153]RPF08155.1 dGTPase [Frondihabitans sp. PhB161]
MGENDGTALPGLVELSDGSLVVPDQQERRHARKEPSEATGDDVRTETERDRGRVAYSPFLRRLAGVTQVVSPQLNSTRFHTRGSHSHKVSLLSREIAEQLVRRAHREAAIADVIRLAGGLDVSATETAGLAHDLGHPPFGHAGEQELNKCLRDVGVFDGFEGNAQTFRIVAKLAVGRLGDPGLNLTNVTLAAVAKYPWGRPSVTKKALPKFGAYKSEAEDLIRVRGAIGLGDPDNPLQQSLEASIMDLADDMAYAIHDLEDFLAAGAINPGRAIASITKALEDLDADQAVQDISQNAFVVESRDLAEGREGFFSMGQFREALNETLKFLQGSAAATDETYIEQVKLRTDLSGQIADLFGGITVRPTGPYANGPMVYLEPRAWHQVQVLKVITKKFLVVTPRMGYIQQSQRQVIRQLFFRLVTWLKTGVDFGELPAAFQETLALSNAHPVVDNHLFDQHYRAISDYICSMSDHEALEKSQWLNGTEVPGMITLSSPA